VTISNAFHDATDTWKSGTPYYYGAHVLNGAKVYQMTTGTSMPVTCTSGASIPTGSTLGEQYSDGNCEWTYQDTILYTSQIAQWPHQLWKLGFVGGLHPTVQFYYNVVVNLWYGGYNRQKFVAGSNGEQIPILMTFHEDFDGDTDPYCYKATGVSLSLSISRCNGNFFFWKLTAAPGDSFVDNLTTSGQLHIDSEKGVTVENTAAFPGYVGTFYNTWGEPIAFSDNFGQISRLQLRSVNGMCIAARGGGPGGQHVNALIMNQDILDCGGGPGGITCDSNCSLQNSVLIVHSTARGSFGFQGYYSGRIANVTIVGVNARDSACFVIYHPWFGGGKWSDVSIADAPTWNNVACLGFPVPWAYNTGWAHTNGTNNMTDAPSGTISPTTITAPGGYGTFTTSQLPGTTRNGLNPSSQLVNPTPGASFDARDLTTGALYNGGGTYSWSPGPGNAQTLYPEFFVPGPDIVGTPRPLSGRHDVGAYQHP
jgi:hypothetical protein